MKPLSVALVAVLLGWPLGSPARAEGPREVWPGVEELTSGLAAAPAPDGSRIAFVRFHEEIKGGPNLKGERDGSGTFQIHVANADGTGAVCVTCTEHPGGPRVNQHKHVPSWLPGGAWLIVSVEMPLHMTAHAKAHGGTGAYVDIWAMSADGTRWVQLTRYANRATSRRFPDSPIGALVPRLSRDGRMLVWAEMIGYDDRHPFGIWRLALADLALTPEGPRLGPVTVAEPGDRKATFYEPWSFFPGDRRITVASDSGYGYPGVMDVQVWDLDTDTLTNLTATRDQYEEQAFVSPDGDYIVFMSTEAQDPAYDPGGDFWGTFRTDIWLMRADGTGRTRLTGFGTIKDGIVRRAIPTGFSPDGRYLYVEVAANRGKRQFHEQARVYRIDMRRVAAHAR